MIENAFNSSGYIPSYVLRISRSIYITVLITNTTFLETTMFD